MTPSRELSNALPASCLLTLRVTPCTELLWLFVAQGCSLPLPLLCRMRLHLWLSQREHSSLQRCRAFFPLSTGLFVGKM